jgi:uncharacterized protein YkwD
VPARRPSPIGLLLVVLVALLAPVAAVTAAGLASGPVEDDEVETADGGAGDGGADSGSRDLVVRLGDSGADISATTVAPATSTSSSTTSTSTTTTTATTAPPTTAPPTAPPTTAPPALSPPATAPPAPAPSLAEQVVALANAARAQAGCAALRIDDRLVEAAQRHSDDMATQGYFSHTSLDGRTFADRVVAAGYPSPGGENIAQGQRGAQAVHDAWMSSEGHRANILNCDFTAIGVGLHAESWTWTQDFGY